MPQSKPENVEKCSLSSKQNIKLKEKKRLPFVFKNLAYQPIKLTSRLLFFLALKSTCARQTT